MEKVVRTSDDLAARFREQVAFLRNSAEAYDKGNRSEARRLALTIRILVHDTGQSKSLLGQLDKKDLKYYQTCLPDNADNLLSFHGLVIMALNVRGGSYVPRLGIRDSGHPITTYPFSLWWDQIVVRDQARRNFTRRDLVLNVSDKDGGAHVDPALPKEYAELSRENSMGWKYIGPDMKSVPMELIELASIRQIAYELEKTVTEQLADLLKD